MGRVLRIVKDPRAVRRLAAFDQQTVSAVRQKDGAGPLLGFRFPDVAAVGPGVDASAHAELPGHFIQILPAQAADLAAAQAGGDLRVEEIVPDRFRFDHVEEAKTEQGTRTILLPNSTHSLLLKRRQASNSPWIFHDPKNPAHPISPNAAYQKLKDLLRKAELPSIRFHDLRHTFATHALQSGVDAKTLSGILGHANASFTLDTYTHVTTEMHRNAAAIVGDFMTEIFGEDLKPWEENESREKEPSA